MGSFPIRRIDHGRATKDIAVRVCPDGPNQGSPETGCDRNDSVWLRVALQRHKKLHSFS